MLYRAARLIAILRVQTNQLKWSFSVAFESTSATNESVLKVPLDHGKQAVRVIKSHDREVVCQKAGDASVVKIIEPQLREHLNRCFKGFFILLKGKAWLHCRGDGLVYVSKFGIC
ncbi:PREDICTED: uncharacterized protein LOC106317870 isoform X1 [Brassica oleracea var. oleracea]|uniref:uncharacterized protein LOC106317870 isoform X1 n=1 Tax=Brassica oleracea var. oleracea TaxID=109376 RepID=UPI0006A6E49F|nr:PREDICTED: uncharacterized protein LOC106317870 isoform X1 [Brassica oleracea var. oleracea]XP_013611120.1 PREDICTED: uncharacterized protein LOC106317870 isoform X1 [Brassica oleracea var. oleracea]